MGKAEARTGAAIGAPRLAVVRAALSAGRRRGRSKQARCMLRLSRYRKDPREVDPDKGSTRGWGVAASSAETAVRPCFTAFGWRACRARGRGCALGSSLGMAHEDLKTFDPIMCCVCYCVAVCTRALRWVRAAVLSIWVVLKHSSSNVHVRLVDSTEISHSLDGALGGASGASRFVPHLDT